MSTLKRRHFLQLAGSTLTTIGLSQLDFLHQAERYGQVLAQGSPGRKLALLVGINAYPDPIRSLSGCLTDIELQRELLVHRFGFNPKDILMVSDTQPLKPTRQTILDAFEQHLIRQAKPGDVVVFHYSGHGSLVLDPDPLPGFTQDGKGVNGTIVPFDRLTQDPSQVQDIMGRSLFLLMAALKTEYVTVVLDSCHSGGGSRGNLEFRAIRSRLDSDTLAAASPAELEFQKRWMAELKLSEADLNTMRRKGIAKGVAIGSAQYNQLAADAPFSDFYAGAFTYLLTRYLWQQSRSEPVSTTFTKLTLATKDVANTSGVTQEPIYATNPPENGKQPIFFLNPVTPPAEAVVRTVTNGQIEFWLGGISSRSLEAAGAGAIFTLLDATGKPIGEVEQTDRKGLVGYGKLRKGELKAVQPGTLMWEQVRGIPADLKLQIGLDRSLDHDRAEATRALQTVSRLEVVPVGQGKAIDYLFGRMTANTLKTLQSQKLTDLPKVDSVGLFTPGLLPLTATFGDAGEALGDAVDRLRSRFKSLLAGRILQLSAGDSGRGDRLKVDATVVAKGTGRAATATNYRFKSKTEFQIRVKNNEDRDLYIAVLLISTSGNLTVLYPYGDAEEAARVAKGTELLTPQENDGYQFTLTGDGFLEVLTLASTQPLRDTLKAIQKIASDRGIGARTAVPLTRDGDSLDVVGALLGDLDRNTRDADVTISGNKRAVNASQLAAISTVIQVVKG